MFYLFVSEFVRAFNADVKHPVKAVLIHGNYSAARKMLAQKHAEHGRGNWVRL